MHPRVLALNIFSVVLLVGYAYLWDLYVNQSDGEVEAPTFQVLHAVSMWDRSTKT